MDNTIPAADREVSKVDNRPTIVLLTAEDLIADHKDLSDRLTALLAREKALPRAPDAETPLATITANAEAVALFGRDVGVFITDVQERHKKTKKPYFEVGKLVDEHFNAGMVNKATPLKSTAALLAPKFTDELDRRERERLRKEQEDREAEEARRLDMAAEAEAAGDHTAAEVMLAQAEHSSHKAQVAGFQAASSANLGAVRTTGAAMGVTKKLGFDLDRPSLDLEALRPHLDFDALEKAITAFNKMNGNALDAAKNLSIKTPIKGVTFKVVATGSFRGA